jgi:hypothetical protein
VVVKRSLDVKPIKWYCIVMEEQEKQERELTFKQRKWIREYLECGNATEAAARVYDCKDRNSAKQIGYENLAKLDYSDLMEEAGITDKMLNDRLREGLNAGEEKTIGDEVIVITDYRSRHKYLETALKLKKRLIERKDITSGGKVILGAKELADTLDAIMNEPEEENSPTDTGKE